MDVTALKSTRLETSTLSRVWEMWKNNSRSFAIMTAFRGEYTHEENVRRNLALAADLRAAGFGYFWLDGFFIENRGKANEKSVSEDCLFISSSTGDSEKLKETVLRLLRENEQEAALIKPEGSNGEVFSLNKTGALSSIGTNLLPNQIAENYSKLRGGEGTFVFAEALVARSNMDIQAQLKKYPNVAKILSNK